MLRMGYIARKAGGEFPTAFARRRYNPQRGYNHTSHAPPAIGAISARKVGAGESSPFPAVAEKQTSTAEIRIPELFFPLLRLAYLLHILYHGSRVFCP